MSEKHRENVVVSVKQGVVIIKSLETGPVTNQYDLRNGISAKEHFPATGNEGNYHLSLLKPVSDSSEVDVVEQVLIKELRGLSRAWPFAGGCILPLEKKETHVVKQWESNAEEVEKLLLARKGEKVISRCFTANVDWKGTYSKLPLKPAIELCRSGNQDGYLRNMFEFYHRARTDDVLWFEHLYKVLDQLKKASGRKTRDVLGIDKEEQRFFEETLNKERHALKKDMLNEVVTGDEKSQLLEIGRNWIVIYMGYRGIET